MNAMLTQILPFLLIFVVFYFLLIRPQQKRQKERAAMLNAVQKGDKVVTIGGLHGTVDALDDTTITLRVNEGTKLTFERSAINTVKKD
ncbi:preprotein translocase subunit YajC [Tumebacillus sp. DT12]|uniref:Preprotein translocase subunit YajC n=1 Tax=Tumebacillus lacus TaxID=2995335 RepID=A0ABT3WZU5_9BACL|nr:preprotein translocase subunit YajC [Tumebacillus lacus]MCX7570185.1 preprotein translocase subunit YajC [Tumebacillus lacus]